MLKAVLIAPGQEKYTEITKLLPVIFPPEELVPSGITEKPLPYLCFFDDDEFIGFAEVLKKPELHYLKYMAIMPQYRSKGYGGKMLDLILSGRGDLPLALDIESLDKQAANYEQRVRRFRFYRKHGLIDTGYDFFYGDSAYIIMSTGEENVPGIMQRFFDTDPLYAPGMRRVVKREDIPSDSAQDIK